MKYLTGIFVGGISGFLIYFITSFIVGVNYVASIAIPAFVVGWLLTSYICTKGATSSLKVLGRGFLIGSLEWMAMIFAGFVLSRSSYISVTKNHASEAGKAGAAIGSGLFTVLSSGISMAMVVVCLLGFVITYFLSREIKQDVKNLNSKKCHDCAEPVHVDARKCKHCGAIFESEQKAG